MPMYWDARETAEKLSGVKTELLSDFIYTFVMKSNYFERGFGADVRVFTEDMATQRDTVIIWANIKRTVDPLETHLEKFHADEGLTTHEFDPDFDSEDEDEEPKEVLGHYPARGESLGHGHMVPPMFLLLEGLGKKQESGESLGVSQDEFKAAAAELYGTIGFKVCATNAHVGADEIFGGAK